MALIHPKGSLIHDREVEGSVRPETEITARQLLLGDLSGDENSSFWHRVACPVVEICSDIGDLLGLVSAEKEPAQIAENSASKSTIQNAERELPALLEHVDFCVLCKQVTVILWNVGQALCYTELEEDPTNHTKHLQTGKAASLWIATVPAATAVLCDIFFPLPLDPAVHLLSLCNLSGSAEFVFTLSGAAFFVSFVTAYMKHRDEVPDRSQHSTVAMTFASSAWFCILTTMIPPGISLLLNHALQVHDIEFIVFFFLDSVTWTVHTLAIGHLAGRTQNELQPLLTGSFLASLFSGLAFASASAAWLRPDHHTSEAVALLFVAQCFRLFATTRLAELMDPPHVRYNIREEYWRHVKRSGCCIGIAWAISTVIQAPVCFGIMAPDVGGQLLVLVSCVGQQVLGGVVLRSHEAVNNSQSLAMQHWIESPQGHGARGLRRIVRNWGITPRIAEIFLDRLGLSGPTVDETAPHIAAFTGQRFRLIGSQRMEIADSCSAERRE